jgi:hypothetical protein
MATSGTIRPGSKPKEAIVHENPEATEEEQEQAQGGRQAEEEGMRYPGHDDPDTAPDDTGPDAGSGSDSEK